MLLLTVDQKLLKDILEIIPPPPILKSHLYEIYDSTYQFLVN